MFELCLIIWLVVWNIDFTCPYIGNVIISIDFHIFQSGRYTTNQLQYNDTIECNFNVDNFFDMCVWIFSFMPRDRQGTVVFYLALPRIKRGLVATVIGFS